jgi:hypothetical protein
MTTRPGQSAAPVAVAPTGGRGGEVSIERLSLRLPGPSAAFGRRVAARVTEQVSRRLPAGARGDLAKLELNVRPRSLSEDDLSEAITKAVLEAIHRRRA